MGFVYSAKDRKIYPLKSCDLLLHQHGESGDPPLDYGFTIKAGNTFCQRFLFYVDIESPLFTYKSISSVTSHPL